MRKLTLVLPLLILVLVACAGHRQIHPDEVSIPAEGEWAPNLRKVARFYFAAQPTPEGLEKAAAAGVKIVINVRSPEELDWDEAAKVKELGMKYYNIPLIQAGTISKEAVEQIHEAIEQGHHEPTLIHCSSGNRAAAWLAVHLVEDHKMSIEDSFIVSRKAGITKPEIEEMVRKYFK